jgi:hypothetical protein
MFPPFPILEFMTIPILDKISLTSDVWTLVAAFSVLIFFGIWFYFTLFRSSARPFLRGLFIVLRMLALVVLLAMILDIRLNFTLWKDEAPETLVLYDLSASMDSAWTGGSLETFHRHPLTQRLEKETRIIRYGGGESANKLRGEPVYSDFREPMTDFESLISGALEKHGSLPDQFVFLTDGQNLKGLDTEQITFPREMSWLVIGVGDTLTDGRFTVMAWEIPDQAVIGDSTTVNVRILYEGHPSREGSFQLLNREQLLAESEKVQSENAAARDVSFTFIPEEEGLYRLSLQFQDDGGMIRSVKGNTRLFVRPRQYAVVIFSDPDPDVAFIRNHLQVTERYAFYTPEMWEDANPGESPDLLLLGPGESPGKTVYAGIPAMKIRGCREQEGREVSRFRVMETLSFTLLSSRPVGNREIWSRFPPVSVLPDPEGIPVIRDENQQETVITYQEEQRILIFNGCGFWRWAWAGYGTEREGAWNRLIDQSARFLLAPRQEWAWLESPRDAVFAGSSHDLPVFRGTTPAEGFPDARISLLDSTGSLVWNSSLETLFQPVTHVRLPGLDAGAYTVNLEVYYQGESVENDSLSLFVLSPDPEKLYTGCDIKLLRRWAAKQGGHALHLSNWPEAEQFLSFDEKYKRHVFHVDFRRNILWILLLLILLTAEWIIRKGSGSE